MGAPRRVAGDRPGAPRPHRRHHLAIALEQGSGASPTARSPSGPGCRWLHDLPLRELDDLLVTAVERATERYAEDLRRWSEAITSDGADLVELICGYVEAALPSLMAPARAW